MISHHDIRWTTRRRRYELAMFRGLSDWRLGLYWERHPHEWQWSLHVPCLSLNLLVVR